MYCIRGLRRCPGDSILRIERIFPCDIALLVRPEVSGCVLQRIEQLLPILLNFFRRTVSFSSFRSHQTPQFHEFTPVL